MRNLPLFLLCILCAACRTGPLTSSTKAVLFVEETPAQMRQMVSTHFDVPPDISAKMTHRVFEVVVIDGADAFFGSGAVIRHNGTLCMVTAAHVVMTEPTLAQAKAARRSDFGPINQTKARASLWARDYKRNVFPLKLLRWKRQFDLALLEVQNTEGRLLPETITLDVGYATVGDHVYITGQRDEVGRRVMRAKIDAHLPGINVNLGELILNVYRTQQPILFGFSGGPVFTDSGDSLIGINTSRRGNESYFTAPPNVQWLLSGK